ncbi:MAG: hypothetical protein V4501_11645 [Pseudomonadota bacterium]
MSFFRKSSKVAPMPTPQPEESPPTQHNNFFASETLYLCMPVQADLFVDKQLVDQAIRITTEQQKIDNLEARIDECEDMIEQYQEKLLSKVGNMRAQAQINQTLENLERLKGTLQSEKAYVLKDANAYFLAEEIYWSPAEAITATLAKTKPTDLILIQLNTPLEKLHMSAVGSQEVVRPNLLSCIETIKSISPEDAKLIADTHKANPKADNTKKVNPVTTDVINEVLAETTEYKKSIIMKPVPPASRLSRSDRKKSTSSSTLFKPLPSIPEKNYFKLITINPQITIAFEEISPNKHPFQSPPASPRNRK